MKNIQVFDRALNATFSIFQATEEEFFAIFPEQGQDIEFAEDFFERVGDRIAAEVLGPIWDRPILKRDAMGIHGSLFYEFHDQKDFFPASKREFDWDDSSINQAQRELFGMFRK
ncbi:MAG: hypothetical protein AAF530_14180 [Pseudomonadota bacterium]